MIIERHVLEVSPFIQSEAVQDVVVRTGEPRQLGFHCLNLLVEDFKLAFDLVISLLELPVLQVQYSGARAVIANPGPLSFETLLLTFG